MRKKILLSVFLIFLLSTENVLAFSDVSDSNKFSTAINYAEEQGLVNGYPDGTFKPFNSINRAEFTKILVEAVSTEISGNNCFPDVQNQWYAKYVCYAKDHGIISGYPDGTFKPAASINLAEALKIIYEALNLTPGVTTNIWYEKYLNAAKENDFLENISDLPSHEISRGEMAQLIYNTMAEESPSPNPNPTPTEENTYSWDGSWTPSTNDFPVSGLIDNEYFDGHNLNNGDATAILPPGLWDWDDSNNDYANYRNFAGSIGTFEKLLDSQGNHFGWELIGNTPSAIDYSGPGAYFEGTSGTDILNLGKNGKIHSFTNGNLGDGPDVLVYDESWTLDFRTGSSLSGSTHDNDLVIAGCTANTNSATEIDTTTIHTGPGEDLVFVRDMERSAIDAGNGAGGITSNLDTTDGDDTVVFRGNMLDFRFFGGYGDDTVFWYIDDIIQEANWLYPNFFGGGGSEDAVWSDPGKDRIVFGIPKDTEITDQTPTQNGQLMIRVDYNYPSEIEWDMPVYEDLFARYCIHCGQSATGEKTLTMEYKSIDGEVFTGYFYVTDFEELQIGVGTDAKVYILDNVTGKATLDENISPTTEPEFPQTYCN